MTEEWAVVGGKVRGGLFEEVTSEQKRRGEELSCLGHGLLEQQVQRPGGGTGI